MVRITVGMKTVVIFLTRKYDDRMKEILSEVILDDRSCDNIERTVHNHTKGKNGICSGNGSNVDSASLDSNFAALSMIIRLLVTLSDNIGLSYLD